MDKLASQVNTQGSKRFLKITGPRAIILSGLFLIVLTLVVGYRFASTTMACSVCHEMSPEYVTWQASSHNKIPCADCHTGTSTHRFLNLQLPSVHMVYQHVKDQYILPITAQPVKSDICVKCHDLNTRVVTPAGDLIIPHESHLTMGVACVECHSGVTHGNIALRQQTVDRDFANWNAAMGEAQMARLYRTTSMQQCTECHQLKNVVTKCENCHKKITTPADHKDLGWVGQGIHGQKALENIDDCDRCHSYSRQPGVISGLNKVTNYARTNTFCSDCHSKKPSGHELTWRAVHGEKASGDARNGCLVCHSERPAKEADKATKTSCQQCHKAQHKSWNKENHPIPLSQDVKLTEACVKCHTVKTCGNCHYIP